MTPGRSCPLHYRYARSVLARVPDLDAGAMYVIGGLYGNRPALEAVLGLAEREPSATLVFNGDFNWFNVDDEGYAAINDAVLAHVATRGNVETELAGDDAAAGCGCAYPDWVGDAEVERSNHILERLRCTASRHAALRKRLAALPMHLVANIAGERVVIVHGDAESLSGWRYARESLAQSEGRARLEADFAATNARVIASSHTCLPVALELATTYGTGVLINNGAAGMPNFRGTRQGCITRIATQPSRHVTPLHSLRAGPLVVEALAVDYDAARWEREFLANWPPGSAGHASYFHRISAGPDYAPGDAYASGVSLAA